MYNLQKTIRYGFWLILEVIALCVGMIYSTRTVRAEPEVQQPARKVTEVVTEKWTVISGKRLDLILKYMGDINFEKEGISLRIPASVAQSWKVAENGTIQALVQKVSNHSYEIKIYKGTQKITDIPGSRIMIPVLRSLSTRRKLRKNMVKQQIQGYLFNKSTKYGERRCA